MDFAEKAGDIRRSSRPRTFKGGELIYDNGRGSRDCTIRDLTSFGARLRFALPYDGPSDVNLQIGFGDTKSKPIPCKVVWRRSNDVGISFDEEINLHSLGAIRGS